MKLDEERYTLGEKDFDLAEDAQQLLHYLTNVFTDEQMSCLLSTALMAHLKTVADVDLIDVSLKYLNSSFYEMLDGVNKETCH
jgi:hypothetical protein